MPARGQSPGHGRCSSTPQADRNAVSAPSSLLSVATELFAFDRRHKQQRSKSATRAPSPALQYSYSFHRSEHQPPSYESLSVSQPDPISYSLSYSRRRSRSSSFLITPLQPTQPWTSPPNIANRQRSNSTPVSPIISPFSASEAQFSSTSYRPGSSMVPAQHQHERSPALELPSPFASPLFYWSGQSRQELTAQERVHQAQIDDVSLFSPYGSPSFYWDGVSRQKTEDHSTLEKAKKTLDKLGFSRLSTINPTAGKEIRRSNGLIWDEHRKAYRV